MTTPVKQGAWLAAIYVALYMFFGYFVAWQGKNAVYFTAVPAELNGLFEQWGIGAHAETGNAGLPVFPRHFVDIMPDPVIHGFFWQTC